LTIPTPTPVTTSPGTIITWYRLVKAVSTYPASARA
jgi:hypothetical protein